MQYLELCCVNTLEVKSEVLRPTFERDDNAKISSFNFVRGDALSFVKLAPSEICLKTDIMMKYFTKNSEKSVSELQDF